MLLQIDEQLEELIVRVLSLVGGATAIEIKSALAKSGMKYSIQGIYKELRKLETHGVVVKLDQKYSLSLSWVNDFVQFAHKLQDTYGKLFFSTFVLPKEREVYKWQFSNFARLDNFWCQILLTLIKTVSNKEVFEWLPHPWFHLIHHEQEMRLQKTLRSMSGKLYLAIGGQNYLDHAFSKYWPKDIYSYSFAKGPFHQEMDTYYSSAGDFILSIKLDKATTKLLDGVYTHASSKADIDLRRIIYVFNQPTRISVKLENNPRKAERLIGKFRGFFQG